jgi:uncharacterized RDD family membrane protein YckC
VRDPDGPEPAERGGDRIGARPLPGVDDRRETQGAHAGVNARVITSGNRRFVAAEPEADHAAPGAALVELEDARRRVGPPLADGVEEDPDTPASGPLVGGKDRLERLPDGIPRKAQPLDDRRGDVNLGVANSLARKPGDEIPRDDGVIGRRCQAAADVAVEVEEPVGARPFALPLANRAERGENRVGPAGGERDESPRRDGPFEVKVEFGAIRPPEAEEKAADGGSRRHAGPSYGRFSPAGEPVPAGVLPPLRLWIRAAAFGVDLLLLAGAPLLLSTTVIVVVLLATPEPPATLARGFYAAQAFFGLLFLMRDTGGASPGKRLFGLALRRGDGRRVTVATSLVRNFPMLVPGWNLIELFVVMRRPDGRRQGDRLAGTTLLEE